MFFVDGHWHGHVFLSFLKLTQRVFLSQTSPRRPSQTSNCHNAKVSSLSQRDDSVAAWNRWFDIVLMVLRSWRLNYVKKTVQAGNCWWQLSFTRWAPQVFHYQSCMSQSHVIYVYWSSYTHKKKRTILSIVTAIVCLGWKRCLATPFGRIHAEFGRPHPGRALVPSTPWTLWCVDRSCHSFRYGLTDWCCLVKMKVAGKDSFMFETWH